MKISWKVAVGLGGVLGFVGGSMHPDSSDSIPLRERMVEMTADTAPWAIGHGLMTIGSALLVVGLVVIRRTGAWPTAGPALPFVVAATVANTLELVLHTAAVLDHDRLAAGDWPPLTVVHLGLSLVTYPLFGAAIVLLAWRLLPAWPTPAKVIGVIGILAGIANALSTPLAIVVDLEGASALFPIAAIGISVWLVVAAFTRVRETAPLAQGASQPV